MSCAVLKFTLVVFPFPVYKTKKNEFICTYSYDNMHTFPAVTYQWYRGQVADFVRPDLNPHIFISSNGKLYFSEVTRNDESDYNCIVKLAPGSDAMSTVQPPSRISLPIPLDIISAGEQHFSYSKSAHFILNQYYIVLKSKTLLDRYQNSGLYISLKYWVIADSFPSYLSA